MAFDLASVLADVSESGTDREQIEYIKLDLIDNDPNNFYQLTDISLLADNISLCGLQQPIRVRQQKENPGRYIIVSGHRRRAALEMLVADGHEQWNEAPCIVERDDVSPALQQLRLIYANANTRKMSDAELGEQADQVRNLLYQLKEEGYEFPGRMRDHVAEAVGASKSKLARLKVIREKLAHCWEPAWKKSLIAESVAYGLARLPKEWQEIIWGIHKEKPQYVYQNTVENEAARMGKIADLQCTHGCSGGCQNVTAMMIKNAKDFYSYCTGCCFDCYSLRTCKASCALAADRKKELKNTEKKAEREAAEWQAERDKPKVDFIRGVYKRIGEARLSKGVSIKELYDAQGRYYTGSDVEKQVKLESGNAKITVDTNLPFGYSVFVNQLLPICNVADCLGCSIDWLFGRSDVQAVSQTGNQAPQEKVSESGTWQTGDPPEAGDYILLLQHGSCDATAEKWRWDEDTWVYNDCTYDESLDGHIVGWIPMPEMPGKTKPPLNNSCKTGMSPTGHCGAAAYCAEPHDCCLNCSDPCNSRCGWLNEEA